MRHMFIILLLGRGLWPDLKKKGKGKGEGDWEAEGRVLGCLTCTNARSRPTQHYIAKTFPSSCFP